MSLVEPTDAQLGVYVRTHVRNVKAGVKASGMSCKIDGYWVVVTVEPSSSQRDWPRFGPNFEVLGAPSDHAGEDAKEASR